MSYSPSNMTPFAAARLTNKTSYTSNVGKTPEANTQPPFPSRASRLPTSSIMSPEDMVPKTSSALRSRRALESIVGSSTAAPKLSKTTSALKVDKNAITYPQPINAYEARGSVEHRFPDYHLAGRYLDSEMTDSGMDDDSCTYVTATRGLNGESSADIAGMRTLGNELDHETDEHIQTIQNLNQNINDETDDEDTVVQVPKDATHAIESAGELSDSSVEEPLMVQWKRAHASRTGVRGADRTKHIPIIKASDYAPRRPVRSRNQVNYREATQEQLSEMFSLEDKFKGKNKGNVIMSVDELKETKHEFRAFKAAKKAARNDEKNEKGTDNHKASGRAGICIRKTGKSVPFSALSKVESGRVKKSVPKSSASLASSLASARITKTIAHKEISSAAIVKARRALKINAANNYRSASAASRETMQELASQHEMDDDEQARIEAALILMNMAESG